MSGTVVLKKPGTSLNYKHRACQCCHAQEFTDPNSFYPKGYSKVHWIATHFFCLHLQIAANLLLTTEWIQSQFEIV